MQLPALRTFAASMILLLALVVVAPATSTAATGAAGSSQRGAIVLDDNRQEIITVFDAINKYRLSKGLPAVRYSANVAAMSQEWSAAMSARQVIEHNPDFLTDSRATGWNAAGEVIAVRWDRKAEELVNWWKSSPGHNAVLLDKRMTVVGIGISFTNSVSSYSLAGVANFFGYATQPKGTYASPQAFFSSAAYSQDPIQNKYLAVGGASTLGRAVGPVKTGLAGGGRLQEYELGSIAWSPASGADVIAGSIRWLWQWSGAQNGFLGYPTSDETAAAGGSHQKFQGGRIAWTPQAGPVYLRGGIAAAWAASGAAASPVRYPIANEKGIPGGTVQDFQAGQFYWSPDGGSRFITGGIKAKWESFGSYQGFMGFPTTNEQYGLRRGGVRQDFQNGVITWTPFAGSHITYGSINWLWNQMGSQSGSLGYPITDEYAAPGGSAQRFEGGIVTWTPQGTTVAPY
ncbi:MAG: SCP-like extracellular [Pseudarthrobacter sp.]|nr:SCP-like extracellular [Pseudarthrobacter sp.]